MEEKYKIHAFYILTILTSIIVTLLSIEWSKVPDLVNYITFALTVSSLILAIIAIIYSIYSNTSISAALSGITKSSEQITEASKGIEESNRELRAEIKCIPDVLKTVDTRLGETNQLIEGIALGRQTETVVSELQPESIIADDRVMSFLNNSSIRGLESLWIVTLSKQTSTAFDFGEFCKSVERFKDTKDYMFAYCYSSAAMGLFNYRHDGKLRWIIDNLHPKIVENIESILREKIREAATTSSFGRSDETFEVRLQNWIAPLEEIKRYFGIYS